MESNLDDITEGFTYFFDFDLQKYVDLNNDLPPISELNKALREKNKFYSDKGDEASRTQLNTFYSLIKKIFYERDDDLNLTKSSFLGRKLFIRYLKKESSFAQMAPMAVVFGLILADFIQKYVK